MDLGAEKVLLLNGHLKGWPEIPKDERTIIIFANPHSLRAFRARLDEWNPQAAALDLAIHSNWALLRLANEISGDA